MQKYFIRIRTNHGLGRQYDSSVKEFTEEQYKKLIELLENSPELSTFGMEGVNGEQLIFPSGVLATSVFEIHSAGG